MLIYIQLLSKTVHRHFANAVDVTNRDRREVNAPHRVDSRLSRSESSVFIHYCICIISEHYCEDHSYDSKYDPHYSIKKNNFDFNKPKKKFHGKSW